MQCLQNSEKETKKFVKNKVELENRCLKKIHKKRKIIRANSTKEKNTGKRIGKMLKKVSFCAMLRVSYLGRERSEFCSGF